MYFSGMIMVRCGNFHEGLIERSDLVAVAYGFQSRWRYEIDKNIRTQIGSV